MYYFCYSTYPGSGLNFLFLSYYQGINYPQESILNILGNNYGIDTVDKLMYWNISIIDLLKITFANPEIISYLFHLVVLKISVCLGFAHEHIFNSLAKMWPIKMFISIYFLLIMLPGYICTIFSLLSSKFTLVEKSSFLTCFLFIFLSSIFIGDPRFSIGIHFFMIFALMRILEIMHLNNQSFQKISKKIKYS